MGPWDVTSCWTRWRAATTARTSTGLAEARGKVRAVNDSRCSLRLVAPLCCVLLRATLAPTALAHDGDESDFVGLFSVLTDVASIVSWCHGFTSMTSMLVSPRRRNTQEYSRPSGPFLFSLAGSCLSGGEARSTAMRACGGYVFTCSRVRRRQHRARLRIVWTVALSLLSGTCLPACAC